MPVTKFYYDMNAEELAEAESLRYHMRWACGNLATAWTVSTAGLQMCGLCKANLGIGTWGEITQHAREAHLGKEFTQDSVTALASIDHTDPSDAVR